MTNYYLSHNILKNANDLYTDYVNNFTTLRAFADYHNITLEVATNLITFGKSINHDKDLMATLYPLNNCACAYHDSEGNCTETPN